LLTRLLNKELKIELELQYALYILTEELQEALSSNESTSSFGLMMKILH